MYISKENEGQKEKRLLQVLKSAQLKIYKGQYYFKETPLSHFQHYPSALAIVRDDHVWSYLIPSESHDPNNFALLRFHFKEGIDNSGFVGWLATRIKDEIGAGVFVVCGQNSKKGGIFDYWGCPIEISEAVIALIRRIMNEPLSY